MIRFPEIFPVLETERLRLRAVRHSDAPVIFRLYSDVRVMEFRGAPVFANVGEAEKMIFHWRNLFGLGQGLRWGIETKESRTLIGTVGFKHILHEHRRADVGYELEPQSWRRGIMTEALRAVTEFGFSGLGLHSIEANITPGHIASQRVLEKLGFVNEAHFRENYFYEGWWDSGIWSLRHS